MKSLQDERDIAREASERAAEERRKIEADMSVMKEQLELLEAERAEVADAGVSAARARRRGEVASEEQVQLEAENRQLREQQEKLLIALDTQVP